MPSLLSDPLSQPKSSYPFRKEDVFGTEQPEASASVVIATKGNQQLSSATIQGVVSLVSGAVENLQPTTSKLSTKAGMSWEMQH